MKSAFSIGFTLLGLCMLCLAALLSPEGHAQGRESARPERLAEMVQQAQVLIDEYAGRRERLRKAEELLDEAMRINSAYAPAYVQAARLTLVGGHIVSYEFQGGTLEKAEALLKKSIALDPVEKDAYVVLGHVSNLMGKSEQAFENLSKATELGSTSPWLLNNFGAYYERMKNLDRAAEYYGKMVRLGAGDNSQQRNAYIDAAVKLQMFAAFRDDDSNVIEFGKLATSAALPDDAWTWGNVGNVLLTQGYFDAAEAHARKALSIMSYGVGQELLSHALYGKWAEAVAAGRAAEGEEYFKEAYSLNQDMRQVIERFNTSAKKLEALVPILVQRHDQIAKERSAQLTQKLQDEAKARPPIFLGPVSYPAFLVYSFIECGLAFVIVWLAMRQRYGVRGLHGGVVLLGGWLLGGAVLSLAIGTPTLNVVLIGMSGLAAIVEFLVFGAMMWLLLHVYARRLAGVLGEAPPGPFRDLTCYAAWWVVIGVLIYAFAPVESSYFVSEDIWARRGAQAGVGAAYGLAWGVIFTVCQNLSNSSRRTAVTWIWVIAIGIALFAARPFLPHG